MINQTASLVIRSSNERTIELCEKLIIEQGIKKDNIFLVSEVPFSATMKKSFEIGISNKLPWTFCVDADVLLRPGSIEYLLKIASDLPEKVCEIQSMMLDKFFCGPRPGGIHLYRTSLLPEVLKRIPPEGTDIRPEFHTLKKMEADGYPYIKVPYIVGIHDYEQYNFDVYRKCYVHGIKHLKHSEMLVTIWKEFEETDPDYKVALRAFADSILNPDQVYINSDQKIYHELFNKSGFNEKDPLDISLFSLGKIETIINTWKEPEAYMKKFPTRWGLDNPQAVKKVRDMIKGRGVFRTATFIFGKAITETGNYIIKLSKHKR